MNDELRDPIQLIKEFVVHKALPILSFQETYECYIDTLNMQVFKPNGYELVARSIYHDNK